ncbi:MAG: hypothetical protein OXI87_10700 [Albidovulum sp.]|nr:hypothetical protein [Albidovulum sp.]
MLADLAMACEVGAERNAKGYPVSWIVCKLHLDADDGGIPINCLPGSASQHDNRGGDPAAATSDERIDHPAS